MLHDGRIVGGGETIPLRLSIRFDQGAETEPLGRLDLVEIRSVGGAEHPAFPIRVFHGVHGGNGGDPGACFPAGSDA